VIGGRSYQRVRGCSGRTSATWRAKKILATMLLVGALSTVTVGGTFAVLNSQESNAHSSVSSGTLTFSNTVNTGSACFSYGAGSTANVNNTCQAVITAASLAYPGTALTNKITITNNGSIDASDLAVYMPNCTNIATPGAPAPGGGNPCASGGADFYIQETDASGTATKCWFLGANPCAFAAGSTLSAFSTGAPSASTALDLGAGPAHGQSRYFVIGMRLPSTADNTYQGQAAQFGLTWHITS
jgi:hypothetical protein